jgi:hypothetical protein
VRSGQAIVGWLRIPSARIEGVCWAPRRRGIFQKGETLFALIPGWSGALGFDVACREPNADEPESWKQTAEEYEIPGNISDYVKSQTLRMRAVEWPPFLIEIAAWEPGWKSVDANDAEVQIVVATKATQAGGNEAISRGIYRR